MLIRRQRIRAHFVSKGVSITALRNDGSVAGPVPVEPDGSFVLGTDLFPGGVLAYLLEVR